MYSKAKNSKTSGNVGLVGELLSMVDQVWFTFIWNSVTGGQEIFAWCDDTK